MNKNNGNGDYKMKTAERLARLETRVEEITTNHLVHLQKGVEEIDSRLDKMTWFLVVTLVAVVIDLVLRVFK